MQKSCHFFSDKKIPCLCSPTLLNKYHPFSLWSISSLCLKQRRIWNKFQQKKNLPYPTGKKKKSWCKKTDDTSSGTPLASFLSIWAWKEKLWHQKKTCNCTIHTSCTNNTMFHHNSMWKLKKKTEWISLWNRQNRGPLNVTNINSII